MTKFSRPDELIKISENSKKNAEKIEKINDMLIEAASNGKREILFMKKSYGMMKFFLNYLKMALQLLKKRKVLSKTHASIFLGK